MEQQLQRDDLGESADIHFRFALAKAHEDRGDYDAAWKYYQSGNERQRAKVFHDPVMLESRHEEIVQVFTREFFDKHAGAGHPSAAPIFIVGLPRSGSTLIEQILASHSQVEGTEELPTFNRMAASIGRYRADRKEYPLSVLDLRSRDLRAYGQQYLEEAEQYRQHGPAAFHRQAAQQLLARRLDPSGPAECPRHQCAPPSARQLPGQLQAAVRAGAELHLRSDGTGDVLPSLPPDHEALARDVAGEGAGCALRGDRRGSRRAGAAHSRALRPAVRGVLRAIQRNAPRRAHGELGAGQAAALHQRGGLLAPLREALGPWREELADIIDELPDVVRNAAESASTAGPQARRRLR